MGKHERERDGDMERERDSIEVKGRKVSRTQNIF